MCLCYCDDPTEDSDRIVSTQMQESNVENNEVITGMKLVKFKKVIYLQIQVGKLIESSMAIDQKSVRWVPVKPIEGNLNYKKSGNDYFVIRRKYEMDLDVFKLDDGEYLTGIMPSINQTVVL